MTWQFWDAGSGLQWGRAQLSAEMANGRGILRYFWSLQWGRAQLSAEIWRPDDLPPGESGFNGAALN
ncbi:hypothetical protein SBA6_410049 [Candidatus Sulfopaludibacter sp. SbA6]|nr:hypothetical protein SBA6_410049 [Candidatus Sulfopaludibacter sp. SbA6]